MAADSHGRGSQGSYAAARRKRMADPADRAVRPARGRAWFHLDMTHFAEAAEQSDHIMRPISAGICVPVFAFVSAGVPLNANALGAVFRDRVALGVIAGLVIGKFVGVFGGARLAVRLGLARLGEELYWRDIAAVGSLAGVGFTVSLLIGDLAYTGTPRNDRVTTAVLIASLCASVIAAMAFRIRIRRRRIQPETNSTALPGRPDQSTPQQAVHGEEMRNGRDSA